MQRTSPNAFYELRVGVMRAQSALETISQKQARRLALRKQLLLEPLLHRGKAGALAVIQSLGYVQIDTISVLERSHHLVLFTRCPGYDPVHLHQLQSNDRAVFEYWGHAMCYLPMADYRFYRRHMDAFPASSTWYRQMTKKHSLLAKDVLKRVRDEGPLTTADFEDTRKSKRGPWWDWKPAKAALEMLFYSGDLMVSERRNFQRVYDLVERVIPPGLNTATPDKSEEQAFFVRRALNGLGLGTIQDISKYLTIAGKLNARVDQMAEAGEICKIRVEGSDKIQYILPEDLRRIDENHKPNGAAVFLSPFDNSIILRDRVKRLFGFDYTLECYVPKPKRGYGYFCLPILWREKFIGRIDLKADRQNSALLVQGLHFEKGFKPDAELFNATAKTLDRWRAFHKCDRVGFSDHVNKRIRKMLSPSF